MGKKYLNTKEGSIEQSVLNVWQEAAEMHAEGMDGRTKEYRAHRGKLESNRTRRENKKNSVKTEQPETQNGAGEHAFEVGTDRYAEYTAKITPGQIEEEIAELNALVEELEEGILGNIAKAAGKTVAKAATSVAKKVKDRVVKKASGSMIGKAVGKVKAGIKKTKEIGGKIKKAAKTGTAYGDEYDPMLEKLEIIESKLNEYCKILEEEIGEENMTENLNLRDTIKNLWIEAASSAVDPKDREELDMAPEDTAKNMKRAKEPAPNVSEEVELDEASGDKEAYKKFFDAALKKFKVSSPAELKGDDKKKFFDYIDKGWEADNEKAEGAMSQVREFKIQSMKAALAQVWGMEEGHNPFKTKNDKKEDDEKNGNTLTGKKKATVDINPDTVSSKSY